MVFITSCFTMHAAQTSQNRGERHVNASAMAAETGALQHIAYKYILNDIIKIINKY